MIPLFIYLELNITISKYSKLLYLLLVLFVSTILNKIFRSQQRDTTLTLSRDSQENANCPTGGIVSFIPKANIGRGLFRPFANIALLGGGQQ